MKKLAVYSVLLCSVLLLLLYAMTRDSGAARAGQLQPAPPAAIEDQSCVSELPQGSCEIPRHPEPEASLGWHPPVHQAVCPHSGAPGRSSIRLNDALQRARGPQQRPPGPEALQPGQQRWWI